MTLDASATPSASPPVELLEAPVALRLFGTAELTLPDARRIVFLRERRFQLLAYLACRRAWVSRDELATFFWPDRSQAAARSNLRKTLLLAQGVAALELQGDRVRWQVDSDLTRFEADVRGERHAAALQWRRGPLLEGFEAGLDATAADWIAFERQRVDALWHRSAVQRLTQLRDQPQAQEAHASAMLAMDPLDEAATAALARACSAAGRTAQGLAAIDAHVRRLQETMGLPPSAALLTLAQELRGDSSAVARRPEPARPAAAPATRFIGRRLELTQLRERLQGSRFVTLLGQGGVGKSSLARTAVANGLLAGNGGCAVEHHWISVGDLADTRQVGRRLAGALGLALQASVDPWPAIATHIGSKPCFVVIDNAESAAGLGAQWRKLEQACPALRTLATSRSVVGVPGEATLLLHGLPLPDIDETGVDVLRHNDAVLLFEARAVAVHPAFELSGQERDVVALVHAVEGLPLAIELAAVWTRLLRVDEILSELQRSLDLLESSREDLGDVGARSLRASFERSWLLVSAAERRALAALSFLPGPFGRDMAQQVVDVPLAMLAALVDKSLLRADGLGRFSLHPLIRQFARQRARDVRLDLAAIADRHASFVAHWLTAFGPLRDRPSRAALDAIEADLVHLRAAWQRAIDVGDAAFVAATASSTQFFFGHRGSWAEGIDWMTRAAERFDGAERPSAEAAARASQALAHLHDRSAAMHDAERAARRSLDLARKSSDTTTMLDALNVIGISLWRQGRLEEARPFLTRSFERSRKLGTRYQRMRSCTNLSLVEKRLGHLDRAIALLEEALGLASEMGHWEAMLHQLNGLATSHFLRCDWPAARAALESALILCDEHHADDYRPVILGSLGRVLLELGLPQDALRTLAAAVSQARRFSRAVLEAEALATLAETHALTGDPARARSLLRGALHNPAVATNATLQMTCLIAFGEILRAEGDAGRTRDLWAWLAAEPSFDPADRAITVRRLAALQLCEPGLAHAMSGTPDDGTVAGVLGMLRRELVTSDVDFGLS